MTDSSSKTKGLSRYRVAKLRRAFAGDLTATEAARALRLNRNTANRYYGLFRAAIHDGLMREQTARADLPDPLPFDARRDIELVVGLFERGDRVFAEIAPPILAVTVEPVLRGWMPPGRAGEAPGWRGYDALAGWSDSTAVRIAGAPGAAEPFWSFARGRLKRFRGVQAADVHLSECVWRWGKESGTLGREIGQAVR